MIWIDTVFLDRDAEKHREGAPLKHITSEKHYENLYGDFLNLYTALPFNNPNEFYADNVTEVGWGISTTNIKADIYYAGIRIGYVERHPDTLKGTKDNIFVLFFDDKYDEICHTAETVIDNVTRKSKNKEKPTPVLSDSELIYEFFLMIALHYIAQNYDKCVTIVRPDAIFNEKTDTMPQNN